LPSPYYEVQAVSRKTGKLMSTEMKFSHCGQYLGILREGEARAIADTF
jgi:hypothetical protein